jgi:phosphoribosylglycinamide formyltransferase 1
VNEAPFRIGVLASGNGTNLQAILDQLHEREGVAIVAVGSDRPRARALERARAAGIATAAFPESEYPGREKRDLAIADWLQEAEVGLIVLAGYMQLLSEGFLRRFPDRVINVHPALLPAFPGLDAIGQALEHGVRVTGVTVHFVDQGVDSGPILLQCPVAVPVNRNRQALEAAIHAVEHELLPEAVRLIVAGRVSIAPGTRIVAIGAE